MKKKPRGPEIPSTYIADLKKSYEMTIQMVLYQDRAIKDIQAGVMDWFTLPPSLRTKEMMRHILGLKQ